MAQEQLLSARTKLLPKKQKARCWRNTDCKMQAKLKALLLREHFFGLALKTDCCSPKAGCTNKDYVVYFARLKEVRMTVLQGIVLGLVQGIAEFLPISSSGHLALAQRLLGITEVPLLFSVVLHLATMCAVVVFFRKRIWSLLCEFGRAMTFRSIKNENERAERMYIASVLVVTLITGVIGIALEKLTGNVPLECVFMGFLATAMLLVFSSLVEKRRSRRNTASPANLKTPIAGQSSQAPNLWQATIIGISQGLGTLPGISRSGATISGALFCNVERTCAGEFSFIASIPAIFGAFILEAKDLGEVASTIGLAPLVTGCAVAAASGYGALTLLMKLIQKGKLEWFACYLIPVAICGLFFL